MTSVVGAPSAETETKTKTKEEKQQEADKRMEAMGLRKVPVDGTMSVVSVAVANRVSEAELRSYNPSLLMDYCDFVDFVWVPVRPNMDVRVPASSPDKERDITRKAFVAATGLTSAEAEFYLDENEWELNAALKKVKEDEAWEREEKQRRQGLRQDKQTPASAPPPDHHHATPASAPPAVELMETSPMTKKNQ